MLLSSITDKPVFAGANPCGACRGIGISLKTYAVKYLLCASSPSQSAPDFALSVNAVESISEEIRLTRLRAVHPKSCAKIMLGAPVYAFDGGFLGKVADLELQNFTATYLFTDRGGRFSVSALNACMDAVILKKQPPYPLGQRIPAPLLPLVNGKQDGIITKPVLRSAIENRALVSLTLSLPPFEISL